MAILQGVLNLVQNPSLGPVAQASSDGPIGLWPLFLQSFDLFTILLLIGSLTSVTIIVICMIEVRQANIIPPKLASRMLDLARAARFDDLRDAARDNDSFLARVVRPAIVRIHGDKATIREAAELAASEESARWFRKIDLLNVIGNLGPLVGLAGTVWGMILAFTSLGATGGQAGPAELSVGISKALFHTLFGLCLAIPCLTVFGFYRGRIDRMLTRAIVLGSEIIEAIPGADAAHAPQAGSAPTAGSSAAGASRARA